MNFVRDNGGSFSEQRFRGNLDIGNFSYVIFLIVLLSTRFHVGRSAPYDEDYLISNTDKVNAVQTGGHWELTCPHIQTEQADKSHPRPDISVSWKHNADILLNIKNGDIVLGNRAPTLTSTSRNSVNGLFMVRADFDRYSVYYDEIVGDFTLTITSARERDGGYWECIVETRRGRHKRIRNELKEEKFLEISGKDYNDDSWEPSLDYEDLQQQPENGNMAPKYGNSDSKPVINQIPVKTNHHNNHFGHHSQSSLRHSASSLAASDDSGSKRQHAAVEGGHPNYVIQTMHVTPPVNAEESGNYYQESGSRKKLAGSIHASAIPITLIISGCFHMLLHLWIFID